MIVLTVSLTRVKNEVASAKHMQNAKNYPPVHALPCVSIASLTFSNI